MDRMVLVGGLHTMPAEARMCQRLHVFLGIHTDTGHCPLVSYSSTLKSNFFFIPRVCNSWILSVLRILSATWDSDMPSPTVMERW